MSEKPENLAARISLRSVVTPDDEDFLSEVYRSTREDLETLPVGDEQKDALMQMQYAAQKRHYAVQYPNAAYDVILFDGKKIGRLIIDRRNEEILCVDVAILPEYRSLGIGTILLRNLIGEAAQTNRIFSLHVEKMNSAVRLYERLGLVVAADTGMHFRMETRPNLN